MWIFIGKGTLREKLNELKDPIKYLFRMQSLLRRPPPLPTTTPVSAEMVEPSAKPKLTKEVFLVQRLASRLHHQLSMNSCDCHHFNLRLEARPYDSVSAEGSKISKYNIRFRLVMAPSPGQKLSLPCDDCTCMRVVSEITVEADKEADARHTENMRPTRRMANDQIAPIKSALKRKKLSEANLTVSFYGPKACRFDELPLVSGSATFNSAISPLSLQLHVIESLCSVLASGSTSPPQGGTNLLGALKMSEDYNQGQYMVYRESQSYPEKNRLTLDDIISDNELREILVSPLQIYRLARTLALSVLQYGLFQKSYFQERWRSQDVLFFLDGDQSSLQSTSVALDPHIRAFIGNEVATSSQSSMLQALGLPKSEPLFSLATVLTEIAFGKKLVEIKLDNDVGGSPKDPFWEYMKLRAIVKSDALAFRVGKTYAGIVERCVEAELGVGSSDLLGKKVQEAYYDEIVVKLESCLKFLN